MKRSPLLGPWSLAIAAATMLGVPLDVRGDYRSLAQEVEEYEPPALFRSSVVLRAEPAPQQPHQPDRDFETQVARIRDLQGRWQKALEAPVPGEAFYAPEPSRVEALRPAGADAAAAEKALAGGFTLETLEALALLRNPEIAAKERELRATLEGYGQVENLDTILRRYSAFTASLMTGIGGMENPDATALKFPFPGVLALKGEVVTQEAAAAREDLEAARRKAITSARKAYWELLYLARAQEISGHMLDLLDNLKAAASARYAAGQTNFQDVIKVVIEREKTKEELRTLGEEQANAEAEIREVLALPPAAPVGAPAARDPGSDVPALDGLYPVALERRQELRAARAMIGRMERMLEMAETMIYPGFSLNLSRIGVRADDVFDRMLQIRASADRSEGDRGQ